MGEHDIPDAPPLDADTLAKLRDLAEQLRDLGLHGRWRWDGNSEGRGYYRLCTSGHGRQTVLAFTRKGNAGQPMFRVRPEGERWAFLEVADDLAVHEVCPEATDHKDPRLYRHDVIGFRSPVADWMATVTPDVVLALLALVEGADRG